jgi:hypothetical protein
MNRSTDQLIKEGHLAIRRGEKAEARRLLEQAAQQNPDDYRVWLGLAAVSKTPQASIAMIDKAAALKPDNAAVLQARKWAEGRLKSAKPASEALPAPMPVRQLPLPNKKQPPIVMTEPVEKSAVSRNLLLRRIVGGAAIFGLIIALGILTWYSWTTWQDDGSLAEIPPTAEVAQLSEVEVSSILPEQ